MHDAHGSCASSDPSGRVPAGTAVLVGAPVDELIVWLEGDVIGVEVVVGVVVLLVVD